MKQKHVKVPVKLIRRIDSLSWTWSKSMPLIPHEYILKYKQLPADEFMDFVRLIRTLGHMEPWGKYKNIYLYIKGYKYWTMGAPVEETTVINRQKLFGEYDAIADVYDSLFTGEEFRIENEQVAAMIGYTDQYILEIGCGTGLLLDMIPVPAARFVGIDPSSGMIERHILKHPGHRTINQAFEELKCESLIGYNYCVSLFGSPSYVMKPYLKNINSFPSLFLMFYKPDYHPVTYVKTRHEFTHFNYSRDQLEECFPGANVTEFNNYLIVRR